MAAAGRPVRQSPLRGRSIASLDRSSAASCRTGDDADGAGASAAESSFACLGHRRKQRRKLPCDPRSPARPVRLDPFGIAGDLSMRSVTGYASFAGRVRGDSFRSGLYGSAGTRVSTRRESRRGAPPRAVSTSSCMRAERTSDDRSAQRPCGCRRANSSRPAADSAHSATHRTTRTAARSGKHSPEPLRDSRQTMREPGRQP